MINLKETLFVVDGKTEIKAFRKKFASDYGIIPDFRKINCNGKQVKPTGYANAASPIIYEGLKRNYRKIVCILDREKRRMEAKKLAKEIKKHTINILGSKYKINKTSKEIIDIYVADIMFENWIISDVNGIKTKKRLIKQDSVQEKYDGKHGCSILKGIMKCKYSKMHHADILFNATRFTKSQQNSSSFKEFYENFLNQLTSV